MPSPIPFEIHITVANITVEEQDRFVQFCRKQEAKSLLIELAKGDFVQQPMLTKVVYAETLEEALQTTTYYTNLLNQNAFTVNRLKIEIPADYSNSYKATTKTGFARYYEWHGKINYIEAEKLLALCETHKVHLSINTLKNNPGIRFITLREFGDEATFIKRVTNLTNALNTSSWQLTKQQAEYCIYDTNHLLDKGWLPQ